MSDLAIFLGRFHPLVVHVPIGGLLLLAVVEAVGWWKPSLRLSRGGRLVVLLVALVSAALAAGCGWLLGQQGNYDATLVDRHRILGLVTLGLVGLLVLVHRIPKLYGMVLVVTLGALGWAGHDGGSLTHGPGYLAEHAPAVLRPWLGGGAAGRASPQTLAQVDVFHDVVQPVLNARCVACHGETRRDGELRLDSFAAVQAGGKNGTTLVAGDPARSLLLRRLYLPIEHKQHMPPAGRPQPSDAELALLDWWIAQEAPATGGFMALAPDPVIVGLVASQLGLDLPPLPDRAEMLRLARRLEGELGVTIRPLTVDEPWLAVTARLVGARFDDAALAALAPIAPAVHHLDLGGTGITDVGLMALEDMAALRRLRLDATAVTDAGMMALRPLRQLTSLNLHTTGITDEGISILAGLPRLRRLYLWQTAVTSDAAEALADVLEDRRKIERYRQQISTHERRIADETFHSDFGAELFEPLEKSDPDDS